MVTCGGAQVALQQGLILRPGNKQCTKKPKKGGSNFDYHDGSFFGCHLYTHSSWLNQVEIWFNIITQKAIRRGTFRSVKELVAKIQTFVAHYNSKSKLFRWTATADSIFEKLQRLCKGIAETRH